MNLLKILDGTPEPPIIDLHLTSNTSGDYNLATPMYEFQKELTDQIVSLHYPDILKYCETNDSKELIVKSLEICINNCMLVSTHPYLLINHYMPKNLSAKDMHFKLAETSGKFNVLKDLMNVIILSGKKRTKNVAVIMKNEPRFFDLCEALLLGCSGNRHIKRYSGHNVQRELKKNRNDNSGSPTNIHLLPHDGNLQRGEEDLWDVHFDTVIIFDGYVDTSHEFVKTIRKNAVIIRLVPMKTIEHCLVYYDKSEEDYLYKLVSSIVCLRESIGNLPPDVFPIYNQKLNYLGGRFFDELYKGYLPAWPLPDLPKIPKFSSIDVERSLLTEVHFHYTPYDSIDLIDNEPKKVELKRTYYQMKRLDLDYITNPLKNDYSDLIGIHGDARDGEVLTHRLIMRLNDAYFEQEKGYNELESYRTAKTSAAIEEAPRTGTEIAEIASNGSLSKEITASIAVENGNATESSAAIKKEELKGATKKEDPEIKTEITEGEFTPAPSLDVDMDDVKAASVTPDDNPDNESEAVKSEAKTENAQSNVMVSDVQSKVMVSDESEESVTPGEDFSNSRRDQKSTLLRIISDIDLISAQIATKTDVISTKSSASLRLKDEISSLESKLTSTDQTPKVTNQLEIWDLELKIKDQLAKIESKKEEKSYMTREVENAQKSLEESGAEISRLEGELVENAETLEMYEELEIQEVLEFEKQRKELLRVVNQERIRNGELKTKLSGTLRFLRHTGHLRKRKVRGKYAEV